MVQPHLGPARAGRLAGRQRARDPGRPRRQRHDRAGDRGSRPRGLELLVGIGILKRLSFGWTAGLCIAGATIVANFAYQEVLDGWAFSGMLLNVAIVVILCLRTQGFDFS